MSFAILLETVGRQRVDTTGFESVDDARNHIRSMHNGYSPKSSDQAAEQKTKNSHYVEVWGCHGKPDQDVVIVSVDSDGNFIDSPS